MILKICAVKDAVVGTFMNPFYCRNEAEAIRSFNFDIKQNKDKIANVNDLQLFCLGEYDEETGKIESKVEYLCGAYIKKEEEEE